MLSMYLYASKAYEGPLGAPSGENSQEYTTEVESIWHPYYPYSTATPNLEH
jgi:hypothetical protein